MGFISRTDIFEVIAGFVSWIVIAQLLKQYLNLPDSIEGALIWSIAWLSQKIIQFILEYQISPHDASDRDFLHGSGLETLREIHCRTNPNDEACKHHQKFHTK